MKIQDRMRLAWDILRQRRTWSPLDDRFYVSFLSGPTKSGVAVDEETSLQVIAVYACVNLLASSIASLPLPLYKRLTRGKERAIAHPLYSLLHDNPNSEQTSYIWRQTSMAHVLLWGNLYSEIEFNSGGKSIGLWPLPPWRVKPRRTLDKQLYWEVRLQSGEPKFIPDYAMFHVMDMGDGITGKSRIRHAIEAVGLTMAAQEFGARLFGQGANMGGVVEHPKTLGDQAFKNLEDSLNKNYAGLGKAHRIMLLEEGMKWTKVGINPEEAQFLETRKFQRNEIATLFSIPPHMIGDLERATFSNIEQQAIDFVVNTLRPWLVNWEQEIRRKLLKFESDYFAEFLVDGLLRGDAQARAAFYNQMFMIGALSPNDIRELENMNPIDGGDKTYIPMNMLPTDMGGLMPSEKALRALPEARLKQSGLLRYRLAKSYERVFKDAGQRIAEREKTNILRAAKKHLTERSVDTFSDWLEDFYRDIPEYIKKQIAPAVSALAEAIAPIASEEINLDSKPELDKFLNEYILGFTSRYSSSSKGQIAALLTEVMEANEDPIEAIETRLNEWEQTRPHKVAMNETVQLSNAIAKTIFAGAGVAYLRWQAIGSEPCPICEEMDGKVVGIEQNFVEREDVLEAEGQSPMKIYRPTSQPPLHLGCQCQITPA